MEPCIQSNWFAPPTRNNRFNRYSYVYVHRFSLSATLFLILINLVRYLRDADQIIVLGNDGHIIEQGTLHELEQNDGYARNSFIESVAYKDPKEGVEEKIAEAPKQSSLPKGRLSKDEQRELLRRSGDTSLYTYYLKSIGWRYGITAFILNSAAVFFIYFPRKYSTVVPVWLCGWIN